MILIIALLVLPVSDDFEPISSSQELALRMIESSEVPNK